MTRKILKNKPLIEAIFEIRWELKEIAEGLKTDPHYKILVGSLYSQLKNEYPYHETLPAASIPDEIAGHVIQHRFRTEKNKWPLIQIGPGILTVNDTEGYIWEDFEKKVIHVINVLLHNYPEPDNLRIASLMLRYIDAVEFDFESEGVFDFLSEKMKMTIIPYPGFFKDTGVAPTPQAFDWRFSFPCAKPAGLIHLRFIRGKKENADALIWETMVQSSSEQVPLIQNDLGNWLNEAHDLTDDWFFKIIAGELEGRFE